MAGKPANKEKIEKWFATKAPHFKIIEWAGSSKEKSKFLDERTGKEFLYRTDRLKIEIYNNPQCYPGSSKEERFKRTQDTNLRIYGSKSPFGNKEVKEKANKKIIANYGIDNVFKKREFQEKARDTIKKRYNVENASQIPGVQEKRKETYYKNTGYENPSFNPEVLEKKRNGFKLKYNTTCSFDTPEIREKIKQSNLQNIGYEYHNQIPGEAARRGKLSLQTKIDLGNVLMFDGKTLAQIAKEKGYTYTHVLRYVREHGFDDLEYLTKEKTDIENIIEKILLELGIKDYEYEKVIKKDKQFYITDFYIEKHKLIIECDGLYWHSELKQKNKNYHFNKKEFYSALGLTSLFFRSDEIYNKRHIIKSIIKNKVGGNIKVGANKCKVAPVSKIAAQKFFNSNHLMGEGKGEPLALFDKEDNILAMAQFCPDPKDKTLIDISRFCTLPGYSVVGGYSKLVSASIKQFSPKTIRTYVDRRYGDGSYLKNMGFVLKENEARSSWTDMQVVLRWQRFLEGGGDEAIKDNFVKIWDCGQARWELDCSNK